GTGRSTAASGSPAGVARRDGARATLDFDVVIRLSSMLDGPALYHPAVTARHVSFSGAESVRINLDIGLPIAPRGCCPRRLLSLHTCLGARCEQSACFFPLRPTSFSNAPASRGWSRG